MKPLTKLKINAWHEAGHVVIGWLMGCKPIKARISPKGGYVDFAVNHMTDYAFAKRVWAGAAAVAIRFHISFGQAAIGSWDDLFELDDVDLPYDLDRQMHRCVTATLRANWDKVQAVAEALIQRKHLDADAIQEIMDSAKRGRKSPA
jgi:ATP-dependent Zn protease